MDIKKCGFVVAMRYFFGPKEGETLQDFAAELKQLTPQDRADFIAMLPSVGYEVTDTPKA